MMKHIITRAGIYAVLAFVLAFLSMPAIADCFQDGFNAGKNTGFDEGKAQAKAEETQAIKQCEADTTPNKANCQSDGFTAGFTAGKTQAQTDENAAITQCNADTTPNKANCQSTGFNAGFTAGKASVSTPTCPACDLQGAKDSCLKDLEGCLKDPATNANASATAFNDIKDYCKTQSSDQCGIFDNPNQTVKDAITAYCSKSEENKTVCGIDPDGTYAEGKTQGKTDCQNDPSSCFRTIATINGSIPETYCDNKTKNCASLPHGKLYLPTVDYVTNAGDVENNTGHLKDVQMDVLKGTSDLLFIYKAGTPVGQTVKLDITKAGDGEVISYPMGIACGTDCKEDYEKDVSVDLFAVPQDSSIVFTGWSGDAGCEDITTNHITVQMNANKNCTATFAAASDSSVPPSSTHKLTVNIGMGSGTVTSDNGDINCNEDDPTSSVCEKNYPEGSSVTLKANAAVGSTFVRWMNNSTDECKDQTNSTITVKMNSDQTCNARFDTSPSNFTLKVIIKGAGSGTVASEDGNINCDGNVSTQVCEKSDYAESSSVTLTAKANEDSTFVEWTGQCTTENKKEGTIIVSMNDNKLCEALFTKN